MKFLLAKKIGMSQVFDESGRVTAVTLLEAEPNAVIRVKSKETDGYEAVQVGTGRRKDGTFRWLREARGVPHGNLAAGDSLGVSVFEKGDIVDVVGYSKGRGFQGVVKRHGFGGAPKSHGTKHAHREPGSIGATHPQHVIKGRKMAGRMGNTRVTVKRLEVVAVDPERNLLSLRGAVPGSRGALVIVKGRQYP